MSKYPYFARPIFNLIHFVIAARTGLHVYCHESHVLARHERAMNPRS